MKIEKRLGKFNLIYLAVHSTTCFIVITVLFSFYIKSLIFIK